MVGWLSIFARYPYLNQNRSLLSYHKGARRNRGGAAIHSGGSKGVTETDRQSNETFRRLQNSLSKNRFRQSKFTEMKWVLIGGDSEIARA